MMKMRRMEALAGLLVLALTLAGAVAGFAAASKGPGEITTGQLIYQGAEVKTQVDVNGEAAVQLIGGALDAAAAQAEEQAKAMKEGGGGGAEGPLAMLPAVAPMIGPARDAIKSLTRITVLVMKPKQAVNGEQFLRYYDRLLSPGGWSPLVTVRDEGGTTVSVMLGPQGKGLFFAVNDKSELVVGLITTSKPLGDLLGQVVSAGGGSLPAILSSIGQRKGGPPAPPAPAEPSQAPEKPEKAE